MVYYCRHHKKTIVPRKVIEYCLKQNCWALKMLSGIGQVKKYENNFKRLSKAGHRKN